MLNPPYERGERMAAVASAFNPFSLNRRCTSVRASPTSALAGLAELELTRLVSNARCVVPLAAIYRSGDEKVAQLCADSKSVAAGMPRHVLCSLDQMASRWPTLPTID